MCCAPILHILQLPQISQILHNIAEISQVLQYHSYNSIIADISAEIREGTAGGLNQDVGSAPAVHAFQAVSGENFYFAQKLYT